MPKLLALLRKLFTFLLPWVGKPDELTIKQLVERIKVEEGFSPKSFWDNEQWTWGYGTKAPDGPGLVIDEGDAEGELEKEIWKAIWDYQTVFTSAPPGITEAREESLVSMLFNLGIVKFLKFKNMVNCIREGDWKGAARHAKNSLWYTQVGRRSRRIVKELETGEHQTI